MCRKTEAAIKVQPAKLVVSQQHMGAGDAFVQAGRSKYLRRYKEKPKVAAGSQMMPRKRSRKASRSLNQCLTNNKGIDRNKSSKW